MGFDEEALHPGNSKVCLKSEIAWLGFLLLLG